MNNIGNIRELLTGWGIESAKLLDMLPYAILIVAYLLIALLTYFVIRHVIGRLVVAFAKRTSAKWDDLILSDKLFGRLGLLAIPIVVGAILPTGEGVGRFVEIIGKVLQIWITISTIMTISAFLDGVNNVYITYSKFKDRPIKVFIQVIMIFLWFAALMVVVSILTEVKVGGLLAGLAGLAAVLMLVFQDSILGFVAGIQFSANNMVRVGDWIVMPSRGVDGDVIDISLTTVKVQNWDKTITTIPTHKLVSESFTNWRGMEESEGRRIKRSVNIDVSTIHYLTDDEIESLKQSDLLRRYMEGKLKEIADYNAAHPNMLDERRLTNIGTFRGYLESWLSNNPNINQNMTHMVRQLQPGPTGIPIEIYCFSAKQAWVDYENVQSDIFDHIYAVMKLFNLKAFQYSGTVIDSSN